MRIRLAVKDDIPAIVAMLANDPLGRNREEFQDILPKPYYTAFEKINQDPNQELIVGESESGKIIATLQLSFIQYLTYRGGIRAQIESVRVHETRRKQGIGQLVLEWAIERARKKGAHVVQLTTDKKRAQTLRFYEKLGFVASHEGMKLHLSND